MRASARAARTAPVGLSPGAMAAAGVTDATEAHVVTAALAPTVRAPRMPLAAANRPPFVHRAPEAEVEAARGGDAVVEAAAVAVALTASRAPEPYAHGPRVGASPAARAHAHR